jgi:hypothetical protein
MAILSMKIERPAIPSAGRFVKLDTQPASTRKLFKNLDIWGNRLSIEI